MAVATRSFAFLDIGPLSNGHALVIPKCTSIVLIERRRVKCEYPLDHAEKMHEVPDEYLRDALPLAKKIAIAQGTPNYNILQNNGRLAHQVSTYTEV